MSKNNSSPTTSIKSEKTTPKRKNSSPTTSIKSEKTTPKRKAQKSRIFVRSLADINSSVSPGTSSEKPETSVEKNIQRRFSQYSESEDNSEPEHRSDIGNKNPLNIEEVVPAPAVAHQVTLPIRCSRHTSERSVHPNIAQIELLLDNLERNQDVARGFLKTQNARQRSRTFWEQLQLQLNSVGGGAVKTWKQWMKYWTDKKSSTKKKAALRAANRRRTGGGSEVEVELTAAEERIVAMMGGEGFSTGDSHLKTPLIHEPSDVPANVDSSLCQQETELPEVIFTYENTTETLNTPEPMAGTSHAGPHMIGQDVLLDISEPESAPVIQRRSSQLQTPTQSPRRQRTSVTNSPRRRHRIRVRASPPSQRQSQFARTTERFVRLEERRMDIEESNASLLRAVLERTAQREHTLLEALTNVGNKMNEQFSQQNAMMAAAFKTLGEGLRALSDTIKPRN